MAVLRYERRACDRCGEEVEMLAEAQAWTGWAGLGVSGSMSKTAGGTVIPNRVDLCPRCAEGFVEWWRAKP